MKKITCQFESEESILRVALSQSELKLEFFGKKLLNIFPATCEQFSVMKKEISPQP